MKWDISVAGHFQAGETPFQGAMREFEEEIGLKWTFGDLKENSIFKLKEAGDGSSVREFIYFYFIKTKINLKKVKLQEGELADLKWMPFDEFCTFLNSDEFVPFPEDYKEAVKKGLEALQD